MKKTYLILLLLLFCISISAQNGEKEIDSIQKHKQTENTIIDKQESNISSTEKLLVSFGLSFLSSLIAGGILIFIIFRYFRPQIKIADCISKEFEDGKDVFRFKFYNVSRFGAVNVLPSLVYAIPTEEGEENINFTEKKIALTTEKSFYVPAYKKTNAKTKKAPHCITIAIQDDVDLEKKITHYGHILEFNVHLTHQLTNISTTITKTYNRKGVIKEGKFAFGNSFDIVKV